MDKQRFELYLQDFGLTRQEAAVYQSLITKGKQTGYEIAKEIGISRSNVYSALSALVEKGAAYLVEESAKKYIPVDMEEFCENRICQMREEKMWLLKNIPEKQEEEEGYITIEGAEHIRDKIRNLLQSVQERVYISCTGSCLEQFRDSLTKLTEAQKKVVVITDSETVIPGALVYETEDKGNQIGIIVDSRYVLSGEYGENSINTCLYSGQRNLVTLFKTALANEIKLINLVQV